MLKPVVVNALVLSNRQWRGLRKFIKLDSYSIPTGTNCCMISKGVILATTKYGIAPTEMIINQPNAAITSECLYSGSPVFFKALKIIKPTKDIKPPEIRNPSNAYHSLYIKATKAGTIITNPKMICRLAICLKIVLYIFCFGLILNLSENVF